MLQNKGFTVIGIRPGGAKVLRWQSWLAAAERGALALLEGDWDKKALVKELCALPGGKHDDMADALGQAVNYLASQTGYRSACAGATGEQVAEMAGLTLL